MGTCGYRKIIKDDFNPEALKTTVLPRILTKHRNYGFLTKMPNKLHHINNYTDVYTHQHLLTNRNQEFDYTVTRGIDCYFAPF